VSEILYTPASSEVPCPTIKFGSCSTGKSAKIVSRSPGGIFDAQPDAFTRAVSFSTGKATVTSTG